MVLELIELLKITAWPVAIIVAIIMIYSLIRRGTVSSLTASKDGISLQLVESRQEREYYMNRRIQAIDQDLHTQIMARTRELKKPLLRAVSDASLCSAALRAIAADLRAPIYQAVDENDFKTKLSSSAREDYLDEKLSELQDEYLDLTAEAGADPCAAGPAPVVTWPAWIEVEPGMRQALESWADRVTDAVAGACRQKIEVYKEYLPQFAAAKDKHFAEIVSGCITKNEGYLAELGR